MDNEFKQPFCDINVPEKPVDHGEFVDIFNKIKNDASRDLKFSTTELKMTALDLHNIIYYRSYVSTAVGLAHGIKIGFMRGLILGVVITIGLFLLFSN